MNLMKIDKQQQRQIRKLSTEVCNICEDFACLEVIAKAIDAKLVELPSKISSVFTELEKLKETLKEF